MSAIILLLTLLTGGGSGQAEVKDDLRRQCYSIGVCMPAAELDGPESEVCSLLDDAVQCMERALAACRLLPFPADVLQEVDGKIQELRHMLTTQCLAQSTTTNNVTTTSIPQQHTSQRLHGDVTSSGKPAVSSASSATDTASPSESGGPRDETKTDQDRHMKSSSAMSVYDLQCTASWQTAVSALLLSLLLPLLNTYCKRLWFLTL